MLADLYNSPSVPYYALQAHKLPEGCSLTGSVTVENLSEKIANVYNFSFPHIFDRARKIVAEPGHDVTDCLILGFAELKLNK